MLAVELRPEETGLSLQDFVGPTKLADFLLKLRHPPRLNRSHADDMTKINIELFQSRPHGLEPVPELRRDSLHRPMLSPQLCPQRPHHPDR